MLQAGRSRVRSAFFTDLNPSDRTMALGLTQPQNEMSTRNISWGINLGASTSWSLQNLSGPLQRLLYIFSCPLLPFISPLVVTLFSLDFNCFSPTLLCLLSSCSMFLWPVLFRYSLNRTEYKPKLVWMWGKKNWYSLSSESWETTTNHLRIPVPGEIKRNTPLSWDKRQPWTVVHTLRVAVRLCYICSLAHRSKCPCRFHQRTAICRSRCNFAANAFTFAKSNAIRSDNYKVAETWSFN